MGPRPSLKSQSLAFYDHPVRVRGDDEPEPFHPLGNRALLRGSEAINRWASSGVYYTRIKNPRTILLLYRMDGMKNKEWPALGGVGKGRVGLRLDTASFC